VLAGHAMSVCNRDMFEMIDNVYELNYLTQTYKNVQYFHVKYM